jgi:hypothetical protein
MVYERYSYIRQASCPPVPPASPEQLGSEADKLMEAAGIRTCEASSSVQTAEFQAKAKGPFVSVSVGGKMTNTNTSSIGCEQVMVITNKYREAKNNISCVLKSTKNVTRTTATGINSIIFRAKKDLSITCPTLKISQTMKLTLVSNFQLSAEETKTIENQTKAVAREVIKAAQESNNGLAATPQGSKTIVDTIKDINETNYSSDINEKLNEITTSVNGKNQLEFISEEGSVRISGQDCEIKQDMVIDLIAASILDDKLTSMLSNLSERIEERDMELEQKAENAGADKLDDFGDVDAGENEANKYLYIAIAVVAGLAVLVGIIFAVMKMKGSSAPPSRIFSPRQQLFSKEINPYIFIGAILFLVYYGSKKEGFEEEVQRKTYSGF